MSDAQLASVRGAAAGTILQYSAGPYVILLRVEAAEARSAVSVHGQLVRDEAAGDLSGRASLFAPDGMSYICDVDRFGEFHLAEGTPGRYRVLLWIDGEVVDLDEIQIGSDEPR
jgi:hypothetical protein